MAQITYLKGGSRFIGLRTAALRALDLDASDLCEGFALTGKRQSSRENTETTSIHQNIMPTQSF
jgi:hypothetical protein